MACFTINNYGGVTITITITITITKTVTVTVAVAVAVTVDVAVAVAVDVAVAVTVTITITIAIAITITITITLTIAITITLTITITIQNNIYIYTRVCITWDGNYESCILNLIYDCIFVLPPISSLVFGHAGSFSSMKNEYNQLRHLNNEKWKNIQIYLYHYSDVIMGAIASQSPASWLFTQPFIQTQIKDNIKAPRHRPLCGEFTEDRWISHKRSVTRKVLPFDDVIMIPSECCSS